LLPDCSGRHEMNRYPGLPQIRISLKRLLQYCTTPPEVPA
jgi:hypothetical protein